MIGIEKAMPKRKSHLVVTDTKRERERETQCMKGSLSTGSVSLLYRLRMEEKQEFNASRRKVPKTCAMFNGWQAMDTLHLGQFGTTSRHHPHLRSFPAGTAGE